MSTIRIPKTVEAAVGTLNGLGALLTAKEWERAAILAAFVVPDKGNGNRRESDGSGESASAFARRGVAGLRDATTVLRYVAAWEALGVGRPTPGETFNIEMLPPWEAAAPRSKVDDFEPGAQKIQDVKNNPAAVAKALGDPKFRKRVEEKRAEMRVLPPSDRSKLPKVPRSLAWLTVEGSIGGAQRQLREALEEMRGREPFAGDDLEVLLEGIARLRDYVDLLAASVSGDSGTDWDADFRRLVSEGETS